MDYSIEKLQTSADCNSVQTLANKEKSDVLYKKMATERSYESYSARSLQVASEIALTNSELSALDTIISTLDDGPSKSEAIVKKTKAAYHLFILNEQNAQYGTVAMLHKEMEITLLEKQLDEIELFFQAVEAKKATVA